MFGTCGIPMGLDEKKTNFKIPEECIGFGLGPGILGSREDFIRIL